MKLISIPFVIKKAEYYSLFFIYCPSNVPLKLTSAEPIGENELSSAISTSFFIMKLALLSSAIFSLT